MNANECLLVSVSFTHEDEDGGVLVVGRQKPRQDVEIINAFQGKEAQDLYLKLITKKEK